MYMIVEECKIFNNKTCSSTIVCESHNVISTFWQKSLMISPQFLLKIRVYIRRKTRNMYITSIQTDCETG